MNVLPTTTETTPDKPLVSIVIPVYNQKLHYFIDALDSALNQSYPAIEVIVSQNHSTNEIPQYLASRRDGRLNVYVPPTFVPMAQNFQFGADQATGDYIAFLCSDDWMHPDFVSELMALIQSDAHCIGGYTQMEGVDHTGLDKTKFFINAGLATGVRSPQQSIRELLRPLVIWIPSSIFRADAYRQLRSLFSGDEYELSFDTAFAIKLHELGSMAHLNKPLVKYRLWTEADGKQGEDRRLKTIIEVGKNIRLVEDSPTLRGYLSDGLPELTAYRKYHSNRMMLGLLIAFLRGSLTWQECRERVALTEEWLHPNPLSPMLLWLLHKPQALLTVPALKMAYKLHLNLQRVFKYGV